MKVCPNCNAENQDNATFCSQCGFDLTMIVKDTAAADPWICSKCGESNPVSAKFCSNCGNKFDAAPEESGANKTQFFGAMQEGGKAKLVLIKGGGFEGVSYQLNSTEHIAGRSEGFILFPEDPYCSPAHANFFYFGGQFFVEDKKSLNGTWIRLKDSTKLKPGQFFRIGEQLFRFENSEDLPALPGLNMPDDGTVMLGSPIAEGLKPRLVHILQGGITGATFMVDRSPLSIGREGCNLNFPGDRFISGHHGQVVQKGEDFYLEDTGSKNGTYIRITEPVELKHGDYVFIGDQLLRVEMTP